MKHNAAIGHPRIIAALICAMAGGANEGDAQAHAHVQRLDFGRTADGTLVDLYVLENDQGATAKVMTYGATLTELHIADRNGKFDDIVLGFDNLNDYLAGHPMFGSTVGRCANRIAKGTFTLDGKQYMLAINRGPNSIHGGRIGFDKVMWKAKPLFQPGGAAVQLSYYSRDGEEGYPGNLSTTVTYILTKDNDLKLVYRATTDKPTPVNLTNHTYFNLAGAGGGDILSHELTLAADQYTPTDKTRIPTGELRSVRGTALDFTTPTPIGAHITDLTPIPGGYDHNFIIRDGGKALTLAAYVYESKTGRVMEMFTTEPAVQLYTANALDGSQKGKFGVTYRKYGGVCLEAQHFPDSVNHPNFPPVILRPGETYTQTTIYKFSAK